MKTKIEDFWHEYRASLAAGRPAVDFKVEVRVEGLLEYGTDSIPDAVSFAKLRGLAICDIRQKVVLMGKGAP